MKNLIHGIIFMFGLSMLGQTFILQERDKKLHFAAGSIAGAFGYDMSYQMHRNKTKAIITGICACHCRSSSSLIKVATSAVIIITPIMSTMGSGGRGKDGGDIAVL